MFKKVIIFLAFVLIVFLPYTPILAQDFGAGEFSQGAGYNTNNRTIYSMVDMVVTAFLSMIAVILFLILFYGGITWMTAMGNEEKVTKAKGTVEAAAIGLAIIMAAYGITYFVFSKLLR